ncbi:MAG TPA: rhodanese-related sulfurtransferase [Candidatus Dormibacteraeota bacterium]|nr:rhodanese-related sulfurtransferase [Candidatus Dormibacteraeota bacterium]
MQKILLYYKFVPVADPEALRLWQRALCEKLNLKGRILIAGHGINGTVGGDAADLKAYVAATKQHPCFKDMDFKWSDGSRDHFPRLSVKVRPEIVTFGAADMIKVNSKGIIGGGKRLKPEQVHELVAKRGGEVVFFDGRNGYEAAVGKFKGAITPSVNHTRDFLKELDDPRYEAIKNKPVVTYCTGGIRCEVLSMVMKRRGFSEVYQLDGGIQKYGEEYGDDGLWEGSLYVFDGRMNQKFSDQAKDIGSCVDCDTKTSNYENCANKACNKLVLICEGCYQKTKTCGSAGCLTRVTAAP